MTTDTDGERFYVYRDGCLVLDVSEKEARKVVTDRRVCEAVRRALVEAVAAERA